jgi:hypothetical protein
VKALVSIGGWDGGLYYSSNVATAQNRTAFVKTVSDFALKYKLDGVDFECVILELMLPGSSSRRSFVAGSIQGIRESVRFI